MFRKGVFWTIGEHSYFVYYPIISYLRIKVHRVETMDMGIFRWNNGAGGKCNTSKHGDTLVGVMRFGTMTLF